MIRKPVQCKEILRKKRGKRGGKKEKIQYEGKLQEYFSA